MAFVTFVEPDGTKFETEVEPGISVMRAAVEKDVPGIIGECAGSMTCGTCHVYVDDAWSDCVGGPGEDEAVILEFAGDVRPTSRLSCQIALTADLDGLVVHVPATQGEV